MAALEPCPFCGASGDDEKIEASIDQHDYTRIRCSVCLAEGPRGDLLSGPLTPSTFRLAAFKWNKRTPPAR